MGKSGVPLSKKIQKAEKFENFNKSVKVGKHKAILAKKIEKNKKTWNSSPQTLVPIWLMFLTIASKTDLRYFSNSCIENSKKVGLF